MEGVPVTKRLLSRELALAVLIVAMTLAFGLTTPGFWDPFSLADRSRHWVEIGLIAVPMTLVIALGGIDLAVGSLLALAAVVFGLAHHAGWPLAAAGGAALVTGVAGGLFNGWAVNLLRIPSLVVTVATLALFRGLAYGLSGAQAISTWPEEFVLWGGSGGLDLPGGWNVPWTFLILLGWAVAGGLLFENHTLGRRCRQLGENPLAARYAGIAVGRVTLVAHGLTGLACGLSAVLWTARFATAHPGAAQGLELEVIAVILVGGTRITGGAGSLWGTVLGLLLLGLLRHGLDLRGVSQQDQIIIVGLLLVTVAVANEAWGRRAHSSFGSSHP